MFGTKAVKKEKQVKKSRSEVLKKMYGYREIYIMLIPAFLYYFIFCYGPMYGVILAFKDYWASKGIWGSPWVGLANFKEIFASAKFWQVFRNTLIINIGRLIFGFPVPIILSLLINEMGSMKYKRCIQTIIYLPHFISWVVISGILFALLSNDGMVNSLLAEFGLDKINFLTSTKAFRPLVIISDIWKEMGWGTIIYLAAISGISQDMYEAAEIDGANRFKRIIYITLPSIVPTISVLLIMKLGGLMAGSFDQIFNLYNEAVYEVGDIIDTYNYRTGLTQGRFATATAVGLFLNLINMIMLIASDKSSKAMGGSGLY
ncbi:MAG: sugar ABC transporter permease [Ruminococcaceae bacterium]|nr:sugar ABC transporter permease [Oscillospiraceae bacterium]